MVLVMAEGLVQPLPKVRCVLCRRYRGRTAFRPACRAEATIGGYHDTRIVSSSPLALCQRKHVKVAKNVASDRINRTKKRPREIRLQSLAERNLKPSRAAIAPETWIAVNSTGSNHTWSIIEHVRIDGWASKIDSHPVIMADDCFAVHRLGPRSSDQVFLSWRYFEPRTSSRNGSSG